MNDKQAIKYHLVYLSIGELTDTKLNNLQWKIRLAVQRLHKRYYKHPWIFITEADIQCALYAELLGSLMKARKTIVRDANSNKINDWEYEVLTRPLHAELSSSRRKTTEFVDLCIIEPSVFEFWIKKTKFNRGDREVPIWTWGPSWPENAIGIEIKFNRWVLKRKAYSYKSKRERFTGRWKDLRYSLISDLDKLLRYKRGWLIFVDHHSLLRNKEEWREFMDDVIRYSNYGRLKKTLNAYYLSPKLGRALSYKSPGSSF